MKERPQKPCGQIRDTRKKATGNDRNDVTCKNEYSSAKVGVAVVF